MVKAKKYILEKYFDGLDKPGHLKLVEEELPPLKNGEFLVEALYLSVDPYMTFVDKQLPLGSTFFGQQVGIIKESKNPKYPVGKYVVGMFGWTTRAISDGTWNQVPMLEFPTLVLPDFKGLPVSLALSILGVGGNTAYFGFLEICKPKEGETVVVSGAAGSVGYIVGQIAKIKKCKVIGIAGSDAKSKILKEELGFDEVINYKTQNVEETLRKLAPQGVDCYFDNIGGEITETVLKQMNRFGRVAICGVLSAYNEKKPKGTVLEFSILLNQLKVEGFHINRWTDRWMEGITQMLQWVKEGKIKYKETVTEGFENSLEALMSMMKGGNIGKAVVKF